jgi:hypothetical protein
MHSPDRTTTFVELSPSVTGAADWAQAREAAA